jgi:hypothetical protein
MTTATTTTNALGQETRGATEATILLLSPRVLKASLGDIDEMIERRSNIPLELLA